MTYYLILRGPLGIGKSTIAKRLSKELNAELISYDRIVDKSNLHKDKEKGYISQKSFFEANNIANKQAKKILKTKPLIFDGNFYWKSQIDDLISKIDYLHYVFTLKASLKTCIKRDNERGKTHGKDAAKAVYKKSTSFNYGTIIDTENKSPKQVVNEIKENLK